MNGELERLLALLDRTLDCERQLRIHGLHVRALSYDSVERLPLILEVPLPPECPFRPFRYREAFDDPDKMLFNELVSAFGVSILAHDRIGDDLPYTIRANCGTVIVASIFGGRVELIDDNPPWVRPFGDADTLRRACDCDPLDFGRGLCPKILDIYHRYHEALAGFPNVKRSVKLVLPDLQGPFDTVELLRGSEIFVDLYEQPDWVREMLTMAAGAQVGFARHLQPLLTDSEPGFAHQHGTAMRGNILIRGDSSVNVSADMYRQQIAEHDECVMRSLDGGGIHFCGNGQHLIPSMMELPSLRCIDFGQPEMNDLDAIYAQASTRRIPLIRVRVAEEELVSGRVLVLCLPRIDGLK